MMSGSQRRMLFHFPPSGKGGPALPTLTPGGTGPCADLGWLRQAEAASGNVSPTVLRCPRCQNTGPVREVLLYVADSGRDCFVTGPPPGAVWHPRERNTVNADVLELFITCVL